MSTELTGAILSREPETLNIIDAKDLPRYAGVDLLEEEKSRTRRRPAADTLFVISVNGVDHEAYIVELLIDKESKPVLHTPIGIAVFTESVNREAEWYTLVTYEPRDPHMTLAPRIVLADTVDLESLKRNLDTFYSAE